MIESVRGTWVALPTPFAPDDPYSIDFDALGRLIEFQVESGLDGIVVAGSTGESTSLTGGERLALAEFAAGHARGRISVLAGVCTGDTRSALELARSAGGTGVDGLLVTTPFYCRPSQRGLARHLGHVADTVELPIVLYNIPSRTSVDLQPETVFELTDRHDNIIAIKESSGSIERIRELVALGVVDVLGGEDPILADCMQLGAVGVISVVANLVPRMVRELVQQATPGRKHEGAAALVEKLKPLVHCLGLESNPVPLKALMADMGWCSGELRSPLVALEPEHHEALRRAAGDLGLLS